MTKKHMDAPDPITPSDAAVTAGNTEPDSVASSSIARADLKGTTGVIEAPTNVPQPSPPSSSSVDGRDLPLRELLDKWGPSVMSVESDMNTKLIHLDPTEAPRRQDAMRALRRDLDAPGRRALAETYKTLANAQFAKEGWRVALVGYLAGAWMLRDGDPPCPKLLANHLSELDAAGDALGPAYMTLEAESVTLRASLLLNFAAAALKLHEWRLARTACEAVLVSQPRNTKALWRLARAYEGDSNLTDALATAVKLFKLDPANAEYERLADRLWARKGRAGKMFNSFLERAQLEGDTLYTQREYERDVSEAMRKGFISCMGKVLLACTRVLASSRLAHALPPIPS